jgi:hypothetical protein
VCQLQSADWLSLTRKALSTMPPPSRLPICMQDLAQLVLIVADGRLHEKDALRRRVRELAAKPGACIVFIAIDAAATAASAPVPAAPTAGQGLQAPHHQSAGGTAPPERQGAATSAPPSSSSLLDMQAVSRDSERGCEGNTAREEDMLT